MSDQQLDKDFWNSRYIENKTGWDLGVVSPPIKDYIDQITNKSIRILIPGAGNAHELSYLLENGFENATIIDIAPKLIEHLHQKHESHHAQIIQGNFFDHEGEYDLILEQTFFCAIDPSMRESYVKKMKSLLSKDGRLCGVLFDREFTGGPPFGGSSEEYQKLFEKYFNIITLQKCENSHIARKGNEVWIEMKPL